MCLDKTLMNQIFTKVKGSIMIRNSKNMYHVIYLSYFVHNHLIVFS